MPKKQKQKKREGGNKAAYALNISYLQRLIKNSNFTQQTLAAEIPCSTVMVSRWVNGKSKITARKLIGLARALDVDACALIESDDRRAIKYLRDLLNKRIEHDRTVEKDLPLLDYQTILQIIKTLGYDKTNDVKIPFNAQELDIDPTELQNQLNNMIDVD